MTRSGILFLAAALLAGFLLGFAFGRRGTERESEKPRLQQARPADPRVPEGPGGAEEMRDELLNLRRRLRDLENQGKGPVPADRSRQLADGIYQDLMDPRSHQDAKRWLRMLGRLAELDPSMAVPFITKYREKQPGGDPVALELAICCGGPDVVALLKEIFGDPRTPAIQRHTAGVGMTGFGLVSQMWPEYAPDPALTELAARYIGSSDPADRRSAIGLLGLQSGDSSRSQLQFIVTSDQDERVRMTAISALARVGDRSTMAFLHQYAQRAAPNLFQSDGDKEHTPLESALQHAVESLRKRFPE